MHSIQTFKPAPADYAAIGDSLESFTRKAIGPYPAYGPKEFAFNAVAEDGAVIGRVIATAIFDEDVEVVLLYVNAGARGKGVGESLMQTIESEAKAIGASGIRTWTPTIQGDGFYQRLGYSEFFRLPLKKMSERAGKPCFNHFFYKSLIPEEDTYSPQEAAPPQST